MSIGTVITEGFGSFGSVAFVVTQGYSIGGVTPPAPTPSTGGGASGAYRYPVGNLDLDTWRRGKKLKARVEAIQKKIQAKREEIDRSRTLERIELLNKQIQGLQRQLLMLLDQLDAMRKEQDEAEEYEVMALYLAYKKYRSSH